MTEGLVALREGRASVDLSAWRKVLVRGPDGAAWLNDILTAELSGLRPGEGRRALLLTPTGRIRADVTVTPHEGALLMVQDPLQPTAIDRALDPYVLSSDVSLEDRSDEIALVVAPEWAPADDGFRPSPLGFGLGLIPDREGAGTRAEVTEATPEDLEAYRIERGVPRVGVDLGEDSLPHEGPLDEAIAPDKGCFLGQEAVAKVRNLGHPTHVVLAVRGPAGFGPGDAVVADGAEVGRITSATPVEDGTSALARVRWAARHAELRTTEGAVLERMVTRADLRSAA